MMAKYDLSKMKKMVLHRAGKKGRWWSEGREYLPTKRVMQWYMWNEIKQLMVDDKSKDIRPIYFEDNTAGLFLDDDTEDGIYIEMHHLDTDDIKKFMSDAE